MSWYACSTWRRIRRRKKTLSLALFSSLFLCPMIGIKRWIVFFLCSFIHFEHFFLLSNNIKLNVWLPWMCVKKKHISHNWYGWAPSYTVHFQWYTNKPKRVQWQPNNWKIEIWMKWKKRRNSLMLSVEVARINSFFCLSLDFISLSTPQPDDTISSEYVHWNIIIGFLLIVTMHSLNFNVIHLNFISCTGSTTHICISLPIFCCMFLQHSNTTASSWYYLMHYMIFGVVIKVLIS